MIIKGLANIKRYMDGQHDRNLAEWYERNPWARAGYDGDPDEEDYVFDALFDIPNR